MYMKKEAHTELTRQQVEAELTELQRLATNEDFVARMRFLAKHDAYLDGVLPKIIVRGTA